MNTSLDQLLRDIIYSLVDDFDAVEIEKNTSDRWVHYEVTVADEDVGKLLGKKGIYANSIRRLFEAAYGKEGRGFYLYIVDPQHERSDRYRGS